MSVSEKIEKLTNCVEFPDQEFNLPCVDSAFKPDRDGYPLLPNGYNEWRFLNWEGKENVKRHISKWALKKKKSEGKKFKGKKIKLYVKACKGVIECAICSIYERPKLQENNQQKHKCPDCRGEMKWIQCSATLAFYSSKLTNRLILQHIGTHYHHVPQGHKLDFYTKETIAEKIITEKDPLRKLMDEVVKSGDHGVKMIHKIPNHILKMILHMFRIDYTPKVYRSTLFIPVTTNSYKIDLYFVIRILKKWDGWTHHDLSSDVAREDLFCYLNNKFLDYKMKKDECLLSELENISANLKNFVGITCSMKQLQMLFHYSPHYFVRCYENNVFHTDPSETDLNYIFNQSHICTHMVLPNFSMTHQNIHRDEYHLLNITNDHNVESVQQSTNLFFKTTTKQKSLFCADFIKTYLHQLRNFTSNTRLIKKNEILTALTEFEKDLNLCSTIIETNTIYHNNLSTHPYVRYLGCPDDGVVNIPIEKQKSMKNVIFNIRMQQLRYPKISFNLHKFNALYEERDNGIHFIFDESILNDLSDCITYVCTPCEEHFKSLNKILLHIAKYHGVEPDWECVKCHKSFTNDHLLEHRWWHKCDPQIHAK